MALGLKLASRAALFGCCSLVAMASAARAADESATVTRLDEVVVTAQRTEQNLQSVPVAVTAMDQAALEKHNIADVSDLQFHVPNFQIREESATSGLTIGIRGISVSADNFAFDTAVGVYVNDVFIARANDFGATFYDVRGVQVLRGPQGTFFGRNTPAGAVLIETNAPGSTFGGYVQGTLGGGGHGLGDGADRNIYRIEGAVDLPISSMLSLRLAGYYLNDNGWGRSLFNGHKFYSSDDGAVRATLDFKPTDRFDARLVLDHSNVDHGGPLFKELAFSPPALQAFDQLHGGTAERDQITASVLNTDPYTNTSAITSGLKGESTSASLRMTYKLSDHWNLKSITGWRRLARDQLDDNLGVPLAAGFYTTANLRQQQLSQELVLTGDITKQLHLVGGLFYFEETGSDQNTINSNIAAPSTPAAFQNPLNLRGQDIKNTSKAVFANLAYDILPTLTASVGYRISQEDKHVFLNSTLPALNAVFVRGPQDFSDKVPLYDAKLTWQATPDLLFYGKYGTGYRAGGIGFRAADAQFEPERVKTYEGGAKWDFNIGSIPARLNVAAFDSDYRNFQVSVVLLNPTRQTVINAGAANLKGAEIEFSAKPTSNLDLSASLGLLDAHYTNFIFNNATLGGLLNLKDNKLRDAPKVNFSASAGYTVPSKIGEWLFQADYAYSSSYELDTVYQPNAPVQVRTSLYRQSPTSIVNARVRLREPFGHKVDVSLWAKNLTDEKVLAFSLASGGLREAAYAEPRSYGVDLRVPF